MIAFKKSHFNLGPVGHLFVCLFSYLFACSFVQSFNCLFVCLFFVLVVYVLLFDKVDCLLALNSLLQVRLPLFRIQNSFHLGTTNNLLTGEIVGVSSPIDARLNCTFLSGFTASARCTVQYGTDPTYMNLPYSAESTMTGTAGDTVSVVLRERLISSTVYYYTVSAAVSGDFTVTVQGSFTTPQYSKYVCFSMEKLLPFDSKKATEFYALYTQFAVCIVVAQHNRAL